MLKRIKIFQKILPNSDFLHYTHYQQNLKNLQKCSFNTQYSSLYSSQEHKNFLKTNCYQVLQKRGIRRKVTSQKPFNNEENPLNLDDILLPSDPEKISASKQTKDILFPTKENIFSIKNDFMVENIEEDVALPEAKEKQKTALDIAIELRDKKRNKNKRKIPLTDSRTESEPDPRELEEQFKVRRAINAVKPVILTHKTTEELARFLRKNVLYADKDLVVFNKPYGIAVHDGDNLHSHLSECFPILSKLLYGMKTNIDLNLCNRPDKNTTGVTICTTNDEMKLLILKKQRENKILKKYLSVVVNEPENNEGMVEIPIKYENFKKGSRTFARMVLSPEVRYNAPLGKEENITNGKKGHMAITYYKLLSSNGGLSLLELQPRTTIKHQLRVHTSDGLGCPILGDHKFAKYGVLAPQPLPHYLLRKFNLPRTKTSVIPMHLHLQQIMIPDIFPDEKKPHLIIGAKIPQHFLRTITIFNLKTVPNVKWLGQSDSDNKIASPKGNSDLYYDPTAVHQENAENKITDLDGKSVKVFKPRVNVRYKK